MKRYIRLVFLSSFVIFAGLSKAALRPSILESEKEAIVAAHNEKRFGADPKPNPKSMRSIQWDEGLAKLAQAWSDRCVFEHGDVKEKREMLDPNGQPFEDLGQNMAKAINGDYPGTDYVDEWDSEKQFYDFCRAREKSPGREIGHYEQVVWADTSHVGCGKAQCAMEDGRPFTLITCDYWPPGNYRQCRPYEAADDRLCERVEGEGNCGSGGFASVGSGRKGGGDRVYNQKDSENSVDELIASTTLSTFTGGRQDGEQSGENGASSLSFSIATSLAAIAYNLM